MAHILIVEDDPILARMYGAIFTHGGYTVSNADNGVDGVTKAKTENPDLVLLDIMMPKMSGLEVLTHLKSEPQTKAIPVVILSNLTNPKDIEQALSLGAVKYMIKSQYSPTQLLQEINALFKKA